MPKGDKARKGGARGHVAKAGPSRNEMDNIEGGLNSLLIEANRKALYAVGRVLGNNGSSVKVQTSDYGTVNAKAKGARMKSVLRSSVKRDMYLLVVLVMTLGLDGYEAEIIAVNLYDPSTLDDPQKEACSQIAALMRMGRGGLIPPRPDAVNGGDAFVFKDDDDEEEKEEEEVNLDDL